MGNSKIIRSDFGGLNRLVRTLGDGDVVRVGIFSKKTGRSEAGKLRKAGGHTVQKGTVASATNAEIGAIHEFGSNSRNIPKRSWLRMPIFRNSERIIKQASGSIEEAAAKGKMTILLRNLGHACENMIQEAFETRGYGKWDDPPLSPRTIAAKGSSAPLIDTAQLRRSVASEVVSRS